MQLQKMSVLNDDGSPLELSTVFTLFLMPNFILITLTILIAYLIHVSKNQPRLNYSLGKIANFFAKGALDRIIRNMLRHFDLKKRQHEEQAPLTQQCLPGMQKSLCNPKGLSASSSNLTYGKKYDANYLLLIPFQLDLLLTVFVYKMLTRDIYLETCQSYLTTYHNRPKQVVCWLKNTNRNVSNLSFNITLHQYCTNQSITYTNYEHNDVICTQYVFKLINIIDTVTNMFAWHQAIVFVVTKSIVLSYWYQHKLRKTSFWSSIFQHQRRTILYIAYCPLVAIYIFLFVLILPVRFFLMERRRVDLTRNLVYACSKFIVAITLYVNLYTLYQWHAHTTQKTPVLTLNEEQGVGCNQLPVLTISTGDSENDFPASTKMMDGNLGISSTKYLTPDVSSV